MSRLYALAASLRALLANPNRLDAATAEARSFFEEPEDIEGISGRLGRGVERAEGTRGYARSTRADEWQYLQNSMRLVNSSNVYGYMFDQIDARTGTLYVQFLNWTPRQFGGDGERDGPGPVYAYFKVPIAKYLQFEDATRESAGRAVWDYLRVRGSHWAHQHQYQLIQVSGDYVPRKATKLGYRGYFDPKDGKRIHGRTPAAIGMGLRNVKGERPRLQLQTQLFTERSALPPRGAPRRNGPNRGGPNRGEPNRG